MKKVYKIRAIAQTLGFAITTIWNTMKKKETTGVLSNGHRTDRPKVTTAVDDLNIVKVGKKPPRQQSLTFCLAICTKMNPN